MRHYLKVTVTMGLLALLAACRSSHPPITTERNVDLQKFMGDWYVIANIPTSIERGAHNAVESYRLDADGSIPTTFTFRDGAFDGKVKRYCPKGFVRDESSKAIWDMQFVWPIKAEYVIVDIDRDYQLTIIGRSDRDYAWIMARTPQISEASYQTAVARLKELGYSVDGLRRVPQRWPEAPAAGAKP